jgi:hypothetical protein
MLTGKEPLGPWPKDLRLKVVGAMNLFHADTGCESYVWQRSLEFWEWMPMRPKGSVNVLSKLAETSIIIL